MKKYALVLFLLFNFNSVFASIYCPQALSCVYDAGCSVSQPFPYVDSSHFNFNPKDPINSEFTEGTYAFYYAYKYTNASTTPTGCMYLAPSNTSIGMLFRLDETGINLDDDATAYENNWKRVSQNTYICTGKATDCPFKAR